MKLTSNLLIFLYLTVKLSKCYYVLTGGRLGDFPPPDESRHVPVTTSESYYEIPHKSGKIPFHVNVYAYSTTEGDNRGYRFDGTGSCQNDGQETEGYGGILFSYNEKFVRLWMPSPYGRDNSGRVIFIGEGWGGNTHSQSSRLSSVNVVVEVWHMGPVPSFDKHVSFYTKGLDSSRKLGHPLEMIPELISVRVTASNKAAGQNFQFHATGSSQVSTKTLNDKSRKYGGIIFAYNHKEVVLWGPSKKNGGCIAVGKRWGDGKESDLMFAHNCTVHIRMWVTSFPLPAFQSEWTVYHANQHSDSFIEIKHNLRKYPSLVRIQYRKIYEDHPTLIFEGTASVQSTPLSSKNYGGVIYAYNKASIRIWLPTSSKLDQAYVIYVGDGWGGKEYKSESVELRVLLYADMCQNNETLDAQGICRETTETEIVQVMDEWGSCSNPCGVGRKNRQVKECSGKSLTPVLHCNFEKDFCGFTQSGFEWIRTKGKKASNKRPEIPFDGYPPGSNFVYSNSSYSTEVYGKGSLKSPMIKHGEKCVLQFHYNTMSYFGYIYVNVKTKTNKWHKYIWRMKDSIPMSGLWRKGFVNFGDILDGPIVQFEFVHKLEAHLQGCPVQCNPVSIADIRLDCEQSDSFRLAHSQCKEKDIPMAGCFVNAMHPYHKGPAWKVNETLNRNGEDLGAYIVADGAAGDEIATYRVQIPRTGLYMLWFENFCTSFKSNDVTIVIDEDEYTTATIFNEVSPMWSPISRYYALTVGVFKVVLKQKEAGFRYKSLMVVPKEIDVWGSLGMQNRLIDDNSFLALNMEKYEMTLLDYMLFTRLNAPAAWMPTDTSKGHFYLQINLPDIAMINRMAIQGGHQLENTDVKCWTGKFMVRYSLDAVNFQWYRNDTLDEKQFEFVNENIKEATYRKVVYHDFYYTLIARAIRMYPTHFEFSGCMTVELYGHYMSKGLCPQLVTRPQETTCMGSGDCGSLFKECVTTQASNTSICGCRDGYHGDGCQYTGCESNPCLNKGKCVSQKDFDFKCDCPPGFKGKICDQSCPKGFFGRNCLQRCKCVDYCHPETGSCICKAGFMGEDCKVACPEGLFGVGCAQKCSCNSYMICDRVSGHCSCAAGVFGGKCEKKCDRGFFGKGCLQKCTCQNAADCNPVNGVCTCAAGWYGENCHIPCPRGLYGQGCLHSCGIKPTETRKKCDPKIGTQTCIAGYRGSHCELGCDPFWYGEDCMSRCTCVKENTQKCDPQKGLCICQPGFRGANCQLPCDESTWGFECKKQCTCQNSADCNPVTGECSCIVGFQGDRCELRCQEGTFGHGCSQKCRCNDLHTESCKHTDGMCSCKPGYHGIHCDAKCPEEKWGKNCLEECRCYNGATCDHMDGFCDCQPGFQGQYCETECQDGTYGWRCQKKCLCQNNAHCDSVSGACSCLDGYKGKYCERECDPGFFGHACNNKCTCDKKNSERCDRVKGTCFCRPGYQGEICTEECPDNFWGKDCNEVCFPCRHANGTCDKRYGNCSCAPGFTGSKCEKDCPLDRYGDGCTNQCQCAPQQICHSVNGMCYELSGYVINVMFKIGSSTLLSREYFFRENLELLVGQCFFNYRADVAKYPGQNITETRRCKTTNREVSGFIVRVVDMEQVYSKQDEAVTKVSIVVQNQTSALTRSFLRDLFVYMGKANIDNMVNFQYFTGQTVMKKAEKQWFDTYWKYVVIGAGVLSALLFIGIIVRCTKRIPQPSPFHKVKRNNSKDSVEMRPCLPAGRQAHLLAFENPYYDVIAAMGLDDDIEEDYYNPLYEMPSDSETEPEDVYFTYRTNRHRHHPFHRNNHHH